MSNEPIPCSICGQFCGDQFDLTCAELRTKIGTAPTINVARDKLAHMAFGRLEFTEFSQYMDELQTLLAQSADPVVSPGDEEFSSPGDEEFSSLSTIELRGYHKGWEAAMQRIAAIYEAKHQNDAPKVKQ